MCYVYIEVHVMLPPVHIYRFAFFFSNIITSSHFSFTGFGEPYITYLPNQGFLSNWHIRFSPFNWKACGILCVQLFSS